MTWHKHNWRVEQLELKDDSSPWWASKFAVVKVCVVCDDTIVKKYSWLRLFLVLTMMGLRDESYQPEATRLTEQMAHEAK